MPESFSKVRNAIWVASQKWGNPTAAAMCRAYTARVDRELFEALAGSPCRSDINRLGLLKQLLWLQERETELGGSQ
jgi:hypothetical protein